MTNEEKEKIIDRIKNITAIEELESLIKYIEVGIDNEPKLTDKEKFYLSNIIRPFRNNIVYISKQIHTPGIEFIRIDIKNNFDDIETINFPDFKANELYKGLELDVNYTLEELGIIFPVVTPDDISKIKFAIQMLQIRLHEDNINIQYIVKRNNCIALCYLDGAKFIEPIITRYNYDQFVNMEEEKQYTLEELGILFKEEDPISIDITDNISTNIEDNTNKLVEEEPIKKDIIPSNNDKDTTVTYTVSKIKLTDLDKSYLDPLYNYGIYKY